MLSPAKWSEHRQIGAAYAAAVERLVDPAATRSGWPQPAELLQASRALGASAEMGLEQSTDPKDQAVAEIQLLGGMSLDLLVAGHLAGVTAPGPVTRSIVTPMVDLAEITGMVTDPERYLRRAVTGPSVRSLTTVRQGFQEAAEAAINGITMNVINTGVHTVEGLLLMDAAVLVQALPLMGGDLAHRLGASMASKGRQIINFLVAANRKLVALIGFNAVARIRTQLAFWLRELRSGTVFPDLVHQLYHTPEIRADICAWLEAYRGDDGSLVPAQDEVTFLASSFAAKAYAVEKSVQLLALIKTIPLLASPAGRLSAAAIYLGIMGYLVGSGYDYVDSGKIAFISRVDGVHAVARRVLVDGKP